MKGNDFGSFTFTFPKSIIFPSLSITKSTDTSNASALNLIGFGSIFTPYPKLSSISKLNWNWNLSCFSLQKVTAIDTSFPFSIIPLTGSILNTGGN